MSLTTWFHGEAALLPRPVKLAFVVAEGSDIADLKAALAAAAVDRRLDQSSFVLFIAVNDIGTGWAPSGSTLDEEQTLRR
jgi:hypothetical protein